MELEFFGKERHILVRDHVSPHARLSSLRDYCGVDFFRIDRVEHSDPLLRYKLSRKRGPLSLVTSVESQFAFLLWHQSDRYRDFSIIRYGTKIDVPLLSVHFRNEDPGGVHWDAYLTGGGPYGTRPKGSATSLGFNDVSFDIFYRANYGGY